MKSITKEYRRKVVDIKQFITPLNRITKEKESGANIDTIIKQIKQVDFRKCSGIDENEKLHINQMVVIVIDKLIEAALNNKLGLCKYQDFIYIYNGKYWESLLYNGDLKYTVFKRKLGEIAENMGIDPYKARHHFFQENLFKQFESAAQMEKRKTNNGILINLRNGTLEISSTGANLRIFDKEDFLTYQLPFFYDETAVCPIFKRFLDTVLPDQDSQKLLSEYMGYVFINNDTLKEEKALFLYGSGANGKSVFYEVMKALLGEENVSQYSLQDLTNENGYYRAMISSKLVNYGTEISGRLQASIFKQLTSGETITGRLPYGNPLQINKYAKLIFNINELPKDVEHTEAFFRRFLIIPFNITIPEKDQNKALHTKIINNELPGVLNWVLDGLKRLLRQGKFSFCQASEDARQSYKTESDSVLMFAEDENYSRSTTETISLKDLFKDYQKYCVDCGYRSVSVRSFSERLKKQNYIIIKKNYGKVVFMAKGQAQYDI